MTSYQRLREQVDSYIDSDIENHEFLSNVEARLTVIRAHLQRGKVKQAKRQVAKLLSDLAARLTTEVPF